MISKYFLFGMESVSQEECKESVNEHFGPLIPLKTLNDILVRNKHRLLISNL